MATYQSQGVYSTGNIGAVDTSPPAAGGERQDLWDVVTRIDPADAPFMNNSPKSTGTAIIHDWQVQELGTADMTAIVEGADVADAGVTAFQATARLYNYMTIRRRDYKVSDTMDSVDHAGHAAMSIRQRTLKALELRRDVEKSLLATETVKSGLVAGREAAGLGLFVGNGSVGATGTFPDGIGGTTTEFAAGTARALTLALIDSAMQSCYEDGGQPNIMYMSPSHKAKFSGLGTSTLSVSNRFNMTQREPATYIGAVDVYLTDFGTLETVIDRFIPTTDEPGAALEELPVFLVDNRHVGYVSMRGRNFKNEPLAKIGDSERGMIISEFTLRSNAPKAHAAIFDVDPAL